ncbi:MAG: M20 family metallopeptidase [Actinobacteria bacterium]|nr:M20 family metallopeptidase [Actinomycetota bacterium]
MIDLDKVITDTQSLIRIDSQNPGIQEKECVEWVARRLEGLGFEPKRTIVQPGRENLSVSIPGQGTAPRLVLLGHLDTVPIGAGWSLPPHEGAIRDGKIYGRGACDMKGGVAVALGLLESIKKLGIKPAGDILFVATVDEEAPNMAGAHSLVQSGDLRADDQVVALEPTGARLRIAQMGLRWIDLRVTGRMAHAGRAHLGIDSAHIMSRIVDRLKRHIESLKHEDPILGRARFTCGVFNAGVATNVVPPFADAKFDVRIVPPMKIEDVIPLVEKIAKEVIRDFPGADFSIKGLGAPRPPVRASEDSHIIKSLRASYKKVTGVEVPVGGNDGHEAYTDASMVAALTGSNSCTVFGPGSTDQAHTADEFVSIQELELVSKVIWDMATSWGNPR